MRFSSLRKRCAPVATTAIIAAMRTASGRKRASARLFPPVWLRPSSLLVTRSPFKAQANLCQFCTKFAAPIRHGLVRSPQRGRRPWAALTLRALSAISRAILAQRSATGAYCICETIRNGSGGGCEARSRPASRDRREGREKDVSTQQARSQAPPRLPCPDGDQGRPEGDRGAPHSRPQAPVRLDREAARCASGARTPL